MTDYHCEKDKLPKGQSYPLKTTTMLDALKEGLVGAHPHFVFRHGGVVFEAFFWFPNHRISYNRLYIRCGSVKSADCKSTREALVNEVLPRFIAWAREVENLPIGSPKRWDESHLYFGL